MQEITLTGKQIYKLAIAAGFSVAMPNDSIIMESEMTIVQDDDLIIKDDDENESKYSHAAYHTEYPEEGMFPLGEPILTKP
jgi:hypothetical protein